MCPFCVELSISIHHRQFVGNIEDKEVLPFEDPFVKGEKFLSDFTDFTEVFSSHEQNRLS